MFDVVKSPLEGVDGWSDLDGKRDVLPEMIRGGVESRMYLIRYSEMRTPPPRRCYGTWWSGWR